MSEHTEQVSVISWFRRQYAGVLIFAIPNGGKRSLGVAVKLKAEGVVPGIPDLFVPAWRLWIEMKAAAKGRLSPAQKEVVGLLQDEGYTCIVCRGAEEAKKKIHEFYIQCIDNKGQ